MINPTLYAYYLGNAQIRRNIVKHHLKALVTYNGLYCIAFPAIPFVFSTAHFALCPVPSSPVLGGNCRMRLKSAVFQGTVWSSSSWVIGHRKKRLRDVIAWLFSNVMTKEYTSHSRPLGSCKILKLFIPRPSKPFQRERAMEQESMSGTVLACQAAAFGAVVSR